MIIQSNLSSVDQFIQSYELPYSAVGPFQTLNSNSINDNSLTSSSSSFSSSLQRSSSTTNTATNNFFPIGNVFDIDPYNSDRLLTCSAVNARFYRLSIGDEDQKLSFPTVINSENNYPCSCVHWNKEKDICLTANTTGLIQLYRRVNKPDV